MRSPITFIHYLVSSSNHAPKHPTNKIAVPITPLTIIWFIPIKSQSLAPAVPMMRPNPTNHEIPEIISIIRLLIIIFCFLVLLLNIVCISFLNQARKTFFQQIDI